MVEMNWAALPSSIQVGAGLYIGEIHWKRITPDIWQSSDTLPRTVVHARLMELWTEWLEHVQAKHSPDFADDIKRRVKESGVILTNDPDEAGRQSVAASQEKLDVARAHWVARTIDKKEKPMPDEENEHTVMFGMTEDNSRTPFECVADIVEYLCVAGVICFVAYYIGLPIVNYLIAKG